jgi:hypothetical protein
MTLSFAACESLHLLDPAMIIFVQMFGPTLEGSDSKFGLWDNGKSEDVRLSLSGKEVEVHLGNQGRNSSSC